MLYIFQMKHIFATWDHLERDGNWELGFLRRNKGAWEAMGKPPSLLMRRTHDDGIERYVY